MRYKLLGHSGLRVSELCLGAMGFGEEWGWGGSEEESRTIFDAFVEAGGNFIDTANFYTNGTSERYIGRFIASDRERFVLGTKCTMTMRGDDPNAGGTHRKSLMHNLDASLKRLETDYIDLLWVHAWDEFTPIEEVMRALDDVVRSGKVLYLGVSNMPAWLVSRANTLAELRGWTSFVGLEIAYSLVDRTAEREMLPVARALDLGVTTFFSLGIGKLSGKYSGPNSATGRLQQWGDTMNARDQAIADEVVHIAAELGCAPTQVALSWVRQQPGVVIPIIATRNVEQLKQNLGCLDVDLGPEQRQRLDKVSEIDLGYPHDFWAGDVRDGIYGEMYPAIKDHHARVAAN